MKTPAQTPNKRIFLALLPDESVVRKIKQRAIKCFSDCQGRVLQKSNWHITLAYFGASDAKNQICIEEQADNIKAKPFELSLSKCGFWKKPAVAWLAPSEIPNELRQLAFDTQQNLIPCGYKPEDRDYNPHITLVRKAKQSPSIIEIEPISWFVNKFCLVESKTEAEGARYTILKTWNF